MTNMGNGLLAIIRGIREFAPKRTGGDHDTQVGREKVSYVLGVSLLVNVE